MDYEFYAQTELCREQVQRASPQYTFPDTGKKDDAVYAFIEQALADVGRLARELAEAGNRPEAAP